ncbi:MAG: hypothetical protein PHC31_10415 [Clostridia bacterium]|nr:hypothetical protein [Clostridia bacterium]MDD3972312.1 hypothetical protein [Clostridia bacterium]
MATDSFSKIADGLMNSRQNIISLTEQDYDATPIVVTSQQTVELSIDLEIQSQAMAGDLLIWGHPTKGVWGVGKWSGGSEVGFILGHPKYGLLGISKLGTQAASWVTEQEYVNI